VSCEGFDYPDDPYILVGSCGVEYKLNGHPIKQHQQYTQTTYHSGTPSSSYNSYYSYDTEAFFGVVGMVILMVILMAGLMALCMCCSTPFSHSRATRYRGSPRSNRKTTTTTTTTQTTNRNSGYNNPPPYNPTTNTQAPNPTTHTHTHTEVHHERVPGASYTDGYAMGRFTESLRHRNVPQQTTVVVQQPVQAPPPPSPPTSQTPNSDGDNHVSKTHATTKRR
jgi:hypothetical protein